MTDAAAALAALEASSAHLRQVVEGLEPSQITGSAYPAEWTVADTLSHLGSGAVIFERWLDDNVNGTKAPDDFNAGVWDEWNAKDPADQATSALVADAALVERLGAVTPAQAEAFALSLGPLTVDFTGFIGLRLKEHLVHTWDVEVSANPSATLLPAPTALVVDDLGMTVGYTARAAGVERTIRIHTTEPERAFVLELKGDAVSIEPDASGEVADITLPAESLIRLVYGRLDPDHTPSVEGPLDVADLRAVFPGP